MVIVVGMPNNVHDALEIQTTLAYFAYAHLPPHLQAVSRPFGELAEQVAARAKTREALKALDALLIAKDAAVRDALAPTATTNAKATEAGRLSTERP